MANHSKRGKRRRAVELLDQPSVPVAWPLCHCGAPAKYEINSAPKGVTFVCAEHLPLDALQ